MEALSVVWASKHFRAYLFGHRCVLYMDHSPLQAMLNSPHPSGKLARWGQVLAELDLDIWYKPGRKNANTDALSRSPVGGCWGEDGEPEVVAVIEDDGETGDAQSQGDGDVRMAVARGR